MTYEDDITLELRQDAEEAEAEWTREAIEHDWAIAEEEGRAAIEDNF
jgi:hypothetical protein